MGTGQKQPEFGFVWLPLDQIVHEGDGLGIFVLTENAAGQAEFPLRRRRLEEKGVSESAFGGDKVLF